MSKKKNNKKKNIPEKELKLSEKIESTAEKKIPQTELSDDEEIKRKIDAAKKLLYVVVDD